MRRSGVCLVVAALFAAGCAVGGPIGREASLEAEISKVDAELREIATAAFGPYRVLGSEVDIVRCDPDDRYRAAVIVALRPGSMSASEARQVMVDWLTTTGTAFQEEPAYLFHSIFFERGGASRAANFSYGRIPGVELAGGTGCYERGRIDAEDPYSLESTTGTTLVYFGEDSTP